MRPSSSPVENLNSRPQPSADEVAPIPPDVENAFLLYAVFCGDVARTAHALNVSPAVVQELARENKWDSKLKPIIELKQSTRAGDVERAVNRALNFVQAHRMRLFLERVIRKLSSMNSSELDSFLFPSVIRGRKGEEKTYITLTTRSLADLASALEKAHTMTYLALNDTATERKERKEDGNDDATNAELHIKLGQAMAASAGGSLRSIVAGAQLQIAQEFASVDLEPPPSDALPSDE